MTNSADHSSERLTPISASLRAKLAWLHHSFRALLISLLLQLNSFYMELGYFTTLSLLGFLILKSTTPRLNTTSFLPKDIDLFFTSVSAVTVSSMSAVEMEFFSNTQLVILTIFMFIGGEVFTSMLGLHLMRAKNIYQKDKNIINNNTKVDSHGAGSDSSTQSDDHVELQLVTGHGREGNPDEKQKTGASLSLKSMKTLANLVSGYLLVVHVLGSTMISIYFSLIPTAKKVLKQKGLSLQTFSIFTTVSTFSNCGFVPTNENMVVFKKNSGLLLILIPQILMGNTLYPVFLRLSIWAMEKVRKRGEFKYMLENYRDLGYGHLISWSRCVYLGITVLGFIILQFVVFCLMEWNSEATGGVSGYERFVGSLFQVVNSRHTGQSVFDLSALSPAILVMFVLMMYLPPYTSYLPIEEAENISTCKGGTKGKKKKGFWEKIIFSQLSYLVIFVILICVTERHKMKRDPLNFNVLNIVVEVISAYGNVGFSVGYSCERQIHPDDQCRDAWFGLAGKWSNGGKFVLILVMFFGRLKKFNKRGGRAWILA